MIILSVYSGVFLYRLPFLSRSNRGAKRHSLHLIQYLKSFDRRSATWFLRTAHYIDYGPRLRHKVMRFAAHEAAQIEFILCEFPGPRLVKTTPTESAEFPFRPALFPNNLIAVHRHQGYRGGGGGRRRPHTYIPHALFPP